MSKPVVFVVLEQPFSERNFERFGIEILEKHFQVRVLDCTELIFPDYAQQHRHVVHRIDNYEQISRLDDLESKISSADGGLFVDYLGTTTHATSIRKLLRGNNFRRVVVLNGNVPTPRPRLNERLSRFWKNKNKLSALAGKFRNTTLTPERHYDDDIVVLMGLASEDNDISKYKHKIYTHDFDYDIFLRLGADGRAAEESYAVFPDQDLAHHVDFVYGQSSYAVDEDEYYSSLNRFFPLLKIEQA